MFGTVLLFCLLPMADDVKPIPLWEGKAPFAQGDNPKDMPSLTPYLPAKEKANGTAVVVCPGGGYGGLAMDHEGVQIAKWLNERGIAAFVLKYRTAQNLKPPIHPAPITDAQRALRMVRAKAGEWGVHPHQSE